MAKIPPRFLEFSLTRHKQYLTVLSLIEDWQSHSSFLVPLRSASHQNVLVIGRCSHLKFSGQPDTTSPSESPSQNLLPMLLVNVNSTPSAHTFFSCAQLVSVCCPGSTDTHFTSCLAQAQNEALQHCASSKIVHTISRHDICHTFDEQHTFHLARALPFLAKDY